MLPWRRGVRSRSASLFRVSSRNGAYDLHHEYRRGERTSIYTQLRRKVYPPGFDFLYELSLPAIA